MSRHTRKGRNPGPVDEWLEGLGYYRKNIAYDETCLFRAASEQIYLCQLFHERVRRDCITYGKTHYEDFVSFATSKEDWDFRMKQLEKHMIICGKVEIFMLSKAFEGVLLFNGLNLSKKVLVDHPNKDYLLLCHMGEDHYDAVYRKSYIENAGICQSIVYSILYEDVFKIPNVDLIVDSMLYQKPPLLHREQENKEQSSEDSKSLEIKRALGLAPRESESLNDYEYMLKTNLAPFPFKVAKALDPAIYRNIEYDTWTEMRKELRLGEWYYGDHNLIEGTGCILRESGEDQHCYIQRLFKHEDKCVVYIAKKGEKRTVKLSDLRPEPDAKPWPLPYRFSKHVVVVPKLELPDKKSLRKRREKKRTLSKCSNNSCEQVAINSNDNPPPQTQKYEGTPLKMNQPLPQETFEPIVESANQTNEECQGASSSFNNTEWSWNQQEQLGWPLTPPPTHDATFNRFFPSTPEVYQTPEPAQYYQPEYNRYHIWPNGEYVAPLPPSSQILTASPHELPVTPDCFNYFFSDGSSYSTGYYPADSRNYQNSPQVEVYSQQLLLTPPPVFSQAMPGTPVILATPEIIPPQQQPPPLQHLAVYSPAPIEAVPCQYIQTSPFVFPSTPSQPWYNRPPPVNSQGFIFPAIPSNAANNVAAAGPVIHH